MKLVLCEGKEDMRVVLGLCAASNIVGLTVEECGGRNKLEGVLREMPKRPEFTRGEVESLAVVIDAETSKDASWQKIQNAVHLGFGFRPPTHGELAGESLRIAGFVISGKGGVGMLEDLCLEAVSHLPGYVCLEEYFRCLVEKTEVKEYDPKAKFRAWMASQKEYDLGVSLAAGRGYVPWQSLAFDPLREFLRSL